MILLAAAAAAHDGQMEANVTKHFAYLFEDDSKDFFQKIAIENAIESKAATQAVTPKMVKQASASTEFEKVAGRLERDLGILKHAGSCGLDAGMQKRANAYIDVLLSQVDLTAEEFGPVFDKVAAAAIQVDLEAAYHQLCKELDEDEHQYVDDVLIKVGHEITRLALLEKEAFLGAAARFLGRAAGRLAGGGAGKAMVRSGLAGTRSAVGAIARGRGLSALEAAGAVGKKAIAPVRAATRAAGTEFRAARTAQMAATRGKVQSQLAAARSAAGAPGLRGAVAKGQAASLEKQMAGSRSKALQQAGEAAKKTKSSMGMGAKAPELAAPGTPKSPTTAPKTPAAAPPALAGAAKTEQAKAEQAVGQAKATEAAKPPKAPEASEPKAHATETHTPPPPPGGVEGKPPGFMDAWKKATSSGWNGLSQAEKGSLIRGGVTAALVYRTMTGKGAVTGGEGVI